MTTDSFEAWIARMGLKTHKAVADALHLSVWTVRNYRRGARSGTGRPIEIPAVVGLACAAVEHGVAP